MLTKILLVDDLPLDILLTQRAMAECDIEYEFVVAGDGEEADRVAGELPFDLLLLRHGFC